MELSLEGILQTLLVGAVSSLCIVAPIFLFLNHVFNIGLVDATFKFVLYEEEKHNHVVNGDLNHLDRVFFALLLIATLFGLGIAAESGSDYVTDSWKSARLLDTELFSDPQIRLDALDTVGKSELRSHRPDPRFRQLYTDHVACKTVLADETNTSATPCRLIQQRMADLYYGAKNYVFAHQTYFDELNKLQARIDFIRTLSHVFMLLTFELLVGFGLASAAEIVDSLFKGKGSKLAAWWARASREPDTLLAHIKNLSALRLFILCCLSALIAYATLATWRDVEARYDKRVFGYFFSSIKTDPEAEGLVGDSSYVVFGVPGQQFEPSAAGVLGAAGDKELLLTANDKAFPNVFDLFFHADGSLVHRGAARTAWRGMESGTIKVEAMDIAMQKTPTGLVWRGYVAGSFENEAGKRYPAVFEMQSNEVRGIEGIAAGQDLEFTLAPLAVADEDLCLPLRGDGGTCTVEGLAVKPSVQGRAGAILLGVRYLIEGNDREPVFALLELQPGKDQRYRAALLGRVELGTDGILPSCATSKTERRSGFGISALDFDPQGDLLVLTSYEADAACRPRSSAHTDDRVTEVQGALWRIRSASISSRAAFEAWGRSREATPVFRFAHKPEGIASLKGDAGTAIVVFDDDASRKNIGLAPATFPLLQSQAVFTVVPLVQLTP